MDPGSSKLSAVISDIDEANSADPRMDVASGEPIPRELLYSRRMSECLDRLYPQASETLKIAARAQHVHRWEIPRDSYPPGLPGYNAWRNACRAHHVVIVSEIMRRHEYGDEAIEQASKLIRKQELKRDPESQALEDVVGVVFVEHYLQEFAQKHDEAKVVGILRKTARKMSADGRAALAAMTLPQPLDDLLRKAFNAD
jgi:hypothetical protein